MNWTRGHPIGRGSTATVSVARTHQSKHVLAVKSIELSKSQLLQREQRILSSLRCPQIVEYMGCDVSNENGNFMYNLFMEYVAGGDLSDAIRNQGGRLDERTIESHTRDILYGLDYLHHNGLVHCDIKGGNILIGAKGAKIADLGCAKWVDEFKVSTTPISGTPLFMAPEVARGEEQSFPADIWALGCTIIEMATGSPPWVDVKDPVAALYRIAFSGDLPEIPSCLSEQAKDFLDKCLTSDPKERWTSAQLLAHPFLVDEDFKQVEESVSNSPTSILDQGFWDSMEEESDTPRNQTHLNCSSSSSAAQRLGRIASPAMPNWALDEEDWITIREDDHVSSDDASSSGSEIFFISEEEEEMELCETSVSEIGSFSVITSRSDSSSSDSKIAEGCKCVNLNSEIQREFISFNQNLLRF